MPKFHTTQPFDPSRYTTRPYKTKSLTEAEVKTALAGDYRQQLPMGALLIAEDEVLVVNTETLYEFYQGRPY